MKEIPLTRGKIAFVDDEDYAAVSQHKWYAYCSHSGKWYSLRSVRLSKGKWSSQSMHRFILGLEYGDPREVDHIDHTATLDNRRENLRMTLNQNPQNVGKRKDNTSGFKGVHWDKTVGKWKAQIGVSNKRLYLGLFPTCELAGQAYDAAALKYHLGGFAVTNQMLHATA